MVAGIAGIATSLGSGTPWPSVAVILAVLAVYDVIAVYFTRHMVTMFK
jgi:presenilin-like A22 family membrane protease